MNGRILKAYPIALSLNPNPYIIYWPLMEGFRIHRNPNMRYVANILYWYTMKAINGWGLKSFGLYLNPQSPESFYIRLANWAHVKLRYTFYWPSTVFSKFGAWLAI